MQATSLVVTYLYSEKITPILQRNPNTYTAISLKQCYKDQCEWHTKLLPYKSTGIPDHKVGTGRSSP